MEAPNSTLYVQNLPDKLNKQELSKLLYFLFSTHGRVLNIVIVRNSKMRGQAHVVFEDVVEATNAMRVLQGVSVCKKPMKIRYSNQPSLLAKIHQGEMITEKDHQLRKEAKEKYAASKEDGDMEVDEETEVVHDHHAKQTPTPTLFIPSLPHDTTAEHLVQLFQQYPGYRSVRIVEGKGDDGGHVAFIDYESSEQAMVARQVLDGFKLSKTHSISVNFTKK